MNKQLLNGKGRLGMIAAIGMFFACSGCTSSTAGKAADEAVATDSDSIAQTTPQVELAAAEEAPEIVFPDAELFGLTDDVESVAYYRDDATEPFIKAKFQPDGSIIAPKTVKITRDKNNRITKYANFEGYDSEDSFTYTFSYSGQSNLPKAYNSSDIGSNTAYKLTYRNGVLVKMESESDLEGETDTTESECTYTILSKDEQGNWTRRRVNETVTSNYAVETFDGTLSPRQHIDESTYTQRRTITYRKQ